MIPVVGNLSEERSGTVGGRTEGVSTLGVRLTEGHVVDGSLCIYTYIKEVGRLLALLVSGVVDFLTEQEREIVLVLQRHVVAGGIGPSVRLNGTLGQALLRASAGEQPADLFESAIHSSVLCRGMKCYSYLQNEEQVP